MRKPTSEDAAARRVVTAQAGWQVVQQVVHAVISSVSIVDINGIHLPPACSRQEGKNPWATLLPPARSGRKKATLKQVAGGEAAVSNLNQS
jgi:hypothetical protein